MNEKYLSFPKINPIIFSFGSISIYWYGLMYLFGFLFAMYFGLKRINKLDNLTKEEFKNLLYNIFLGVVLGGRIGYVFFYNTKNLLQHPFYIFEIWNGGMSFHGGFLGVVIVILLFTYRNKKNFFQISDFIVPLVPFGLGAGRIGNFINCELWGRIAPNISWSMLFPNSYFEDILISNKNLELQSILNQYGTLPRHPSQIYEFFLEGVILFIILNVFALRNNKVGLNTGLFLTFYGLFRCFAEFFRQPDIQLGLFKNIISMGQILSIPMIFIGCLIIFLSYRNKLK